MLKINIHEFNCYESKEIYEFLFLKGETVFEIAIPRKEVNGSADNYDIFVEYLSAAYAGQCLSEISNSFAYNVPYVYSNQPFVFEIAITQMGKMAEALFLIIHSVNGKIPNESFLTFHSLAADFLTNAFNGKIQCATWGLLHIANHYLKDY